MEPATTIMQDSQIKEGPVEDKIALYVDDVLLYVKHPLCSLKTIVFQIDASHSIDIKL